MRVAVLGTGIMGAAMAKNVAARGHDVVVWNRTRAKAEATGLAAASSPREAVDGADVVLTVLRDLAAVREAMDGVELGDAAWMQSSTVGLGVEELTGPLVDAPVVGTRGPAEEGKLTAFLSGPPDLRERVRPVADAVAQKVVDVGDRVGDATRLKLVLNAWVLMLTEATAELLALAEGAELDPRAVLDALKGGPTDAAYLQTKGAAIVERAFAPQFKLETALKDAGLVRELAARSGVEVALIDATAERFTRAVEAGHGEEDMAATWFAARYSSGRHDDAPTRAHRPTRRHVMAKNPFDRLADLGEEVLGKASQSPNVARVVGSAMQMKDKVDDLTKRVRGLEAMEKRLAEVEARLAKLESAATTKRVTSGAKAKGATKEQ